MSVIECEVTCDDEIKFLLKNLNLMTKEDVNKSIDNIFSFLSANEPKYIEKIISVFYKLIDNKDFMFSPEHTDKLIETSKLVEMRDEKNKASINNFLCKYLSNKDRFINATTNNSAIYYEIITPNDINIDLFLDVLFFIDFDFVESYIQNNLEVIKKLPDKQKNRIIKYYLQNYSCDNTKLKNLVENLDFTLSEKHLVYACSIVFPKIELITYILNKKVQPTTKAFRRLIDRDPEDIDAISEIINLFIFFGYVLTRDDIFIICKVKYKLSNIENIEADNEILLMCCKNNFFPKYIKFKPTLDEFHNMFKIRTNVTSIKKYVSKTKMNYDVTCLENACCYGDKKIIDFLVSKNVKPTLKRIKLFLTGTNASDDKNLILYNFIKDNYDKIKNKNQNTLEILYRLSLSFLKQLPDSLLQ